MSKFHDTLKKLHEAATPGPWAEYANTIVLQNPQGQSVRRNADDFKFIGHDWSMEDAELIAKLRNSVPKLLRLLETAKEALATYPEGHMHERAWVVAFEEYDRLDELERALDALDELDEDVKEKP